MKTLTLMRHGRAEPKDPRLSDFDRPLHRRGVLEATNMAERARETERVPDIIVASSALRTRQTAEAFARTIELPSRKVLREDQLYLAEADEILEVVRGAGNRVAHLMLVGHNPGLSTCANRLTATGALGEFDTGALCTFELPIENWSDARFGIGRNPQYDTPKRFFDLWS